jgi:lipopolysaccharide biosynthesis glycosyltransferase
LINDNIFKRIDNDGATEFTYTRFFVPYLNNYKGYALFVDSDFLWECDILELFDNFINPNYAVSCVKHKYVNCNGKTKMDGRKQEWYPKKNWSSLMIFNCEHKNVIKNLILENTNFKSAKWLHRMEWCEEKEILEIPKEYNFLVDYYFDGNIKALHYTDGGPWHPGYENVTFGDRWLEYITHDEKEKIKWSIENEYKNI